MKTVSNVIRTILLGGSILATAMPLAVNAESAKGGATVAPRGFCANITQDEAKITSGVTEQVNKLTQARSKADAELARDRSRIDSDVTADRAKADADRQNHFSALDAKATTPIQKTAVSTFEQTVLAAVAARRSSVDAARATFRSGESQLIAARRAKIDAGLAAFKANIATAEANAQSACSAGTAPNTVHSTFVAALKSARTSFHAATTSVDPIGGKVAALAQTRNAAFKAADANFKSTIEQAAANLKTALHQR